jgi:hypothetical protein
MNDEQFKELCKDGLKKALAQGDGWSAHFHGKMLLPGFVTSPRPKYYYIKWID